MHRLPPRPAAQVREDQGEVGERLEHRSGTGSPKGRPPWPTPSGTAPRGRDRRRSGRSAGSGDRRAGRPGQRDGSRSAGPANLHHLRRCATPSSPPRTTGSPRRTPSARDARRRPRRPPVGRDEPIGVQRGTGRPVDLVQEGDREEVGDDGVGEAASRIAVSASSRSPSKREKTTSCPGHTPRSRTRPCRAPASFDR